MNPHGVLPRATASRERVDCGVRTTAGRWLAAGLLVVGILGMGACSGSTPSRPQAAASETSTPPLSPSAPATRRIPAPGPSSVQPAPVTPDAVVLAYFQAINDHNYAEAWRLGGKNLGQSYGAFVSGFADTESDAVTITETNGDTVSIQLLATHTDGSQQHYAGTYTVTDGVITSAEVHAVPSAPGAATCGAPENPYGYTFCGTDQLIYSTPPDFCSYFTCIDTFEDGRGYVVQCADGDFSKSGGRPGACSSHEGVRRPLYAAR